MSRNPNSHNNKHDHKTVFDNNSRNPSTIDPRSETPKNRMIIINPINSVVFGGEQEPTMRPDLVSNLMTSQHQQQAAVSLFQAQQLQKQEHPYVTTESSTGIAVPRPLGREPGPTDVICARGKRALNHEGNRRFRQLVEHHMEAYSQASTKMEKSLLVSQIIDSIRYAEPPGGFLRERDDQARSWYEVGDAVAREKVGQAFRDLLHTKYKSSTKAKKRRRVQQLKRGASDSEHEHEHDEEEEIERKQEGARTTAALMGGVVPAAGLAEHSTHTNITSNQNDSDEDSWASLCEMEESSLTKEAPDFATNHQVAKLERGSAVEAMDVHNLRSLHKQQQELLQQVQQQQQQLQQQQQQLILQQQQQEQQQRLQQLGDSVGLDASSTGTASNTRLPAWTAQRQTHSESHATMEAASQPQHQQQTPKDLVAHSIPEFMDVEPVSLEQIISASRGSISSSLGLTDGSVLGSSSREVFRPSFLADLNDIATWEEQQGVVNASTDDNNIRSILCDNSTNNTINNTVADDRRTDGNNENVQHDDGRTITSQRSPRME